VGLLALAVIVQMFRLQTVEAPKLRAMSDSLNTKFVNIDAIRGNIYAADGSLLSTSIPIYELRMDTRVESITRKFFNDNVDSLAWCLSTYFQDKTAQQYKAELKNARAKKSRYYFIHRGLTFSQVKDIRKFPIFRLGKYKGGLIVIEDSRRIQPFGKLAFRTIGYTRRDVKPVGIEGAFERYLGGTAGKRLMQRAPGGDYIPVNKDNEIDPEDGKDIYTTLDVNFQDITEDALEKVLKENNAEHGCAIVMEVATGHIKAIANLTRQGDEGEYVEKYNYAIGESTEPGSTFKLVSLISLLEDGKATPETPINIEGGQTRFYDRVMKDAHGGRETVTLKQGFEISSNVAISKAVYQAYAKTPSQFTNHIHLLKLDEQLGLPIHGEGKPRIKTPKSRDWYGTSLPWMSIGYELQITPLQTLTLYNAIANNGTMVKPMFVTEIRETGKPIKTFNTEVMNPKICSDKTLAIVHQFLEGVVEEGTATNIKNDLYKIAGKTGTAQVANENGTYHEQNKYQASFVGYFPANKPAYSIIVVINNPSNGIYYGASVAGPVFKEISDKIYAWTSSTHSYLAAFTPQDSKLPVAGGINQEHLSTLASLYKDKPSIQVPPAEDIWVKAVVNANTLQTQDIEVKTQTVPDVTGMTLADALYLLENNGLQVRISGKGKVASQSLPAGTTYRSPQTIQINLN
jgi:cell division protein FtsI (penicillin-binding protein 3)